ncbi:hypothetical protein D3C76_934840 [compost metagenome]
MHVHLCQVLQNLGYLMQLDPVVLQVLPGGEMPVAAIIVASDSRQGAQLPRRQSAVGNCDPQHIGMLLHIQTVLQTQRQKLFFAQLARLIAFDLIAKLLYALQHQCTVVVVVLIHARVLISVCPLTRGNFDGVNMRLH